MRKVLALLAAFAVFGGVQAMAASRGGITSTKAGVDNGAAASCDTDGVTTSYTTGWDTVDRRHEISAVTVGGVNDACDGLNLSVWLTNAAGIQVGTGTMAIPASAARSFAVTLSLAASAKSTEGVHVLIAA